jgi:hypothetical protein
MSHRPKLVPIVLVACLAMFPGCGGDGGTGPSGPSDPPLVNTPDDVIESLRIGWEARNPDLAALLSDTFTFHFAPFDVEFWGAPATWSGGAELGCLGHIFSGDPGERPGGIAQPAVDTRFTFGLILTPVEVDWAVTPRQDPPYAGLLARRYDVIMAAQYVNTDFDFVGSRNEFFLGIETFTRDDGTEARRYVLQEWRDLGNPDPVLRHGTISWGFFKWMYR